MSRSQESIVALDVGERRIGVAVATRPVAIAIPYAVVEVDGSELGAVARIVGYEDATRVVIGYPRNQSGEPTQQTAFVEAFATRLTPLVPNIIFQDESLTSVIAEQRLQSRKKPYTKGDIDAEAAAIILQDYLEQTV